MVDTQTNKQRRERERKKKERDTHTLSISTPLTHTHKHTQQTKQALRVLGVVVAIVRPFNADHSGFDGVRNVVLRGVRDDDT